MSGDFDDCFNYFNEPKEARELRQAMAADAAKKRFAALPTDGKPWHLVAVCIALMTDTGTHWAYELRDKDGKPVTPELCCDVTDKTFFDLVNEACGNQLVRRE